MAFLPALAAAAPAAAGATAATAAAGSALATGISAGALLGTKAATSGILGGLGLNALGGMASVLPASASLAAAAPTALGAAGTALSPTIFAKAAPALGGLSAGTTIPALASTTPAVASAAAPGLLQTAGMSPLGGMTSVLPAGTSIPSAGGIQSLAANAPNAATNYLMQGPNAAANIPSIETRQLADLASAGSKSGLKMSTTEGLRLSPELSQTALTPGGSPINPNAGFLENFGNLLQNPSLRGLGDYVEKHPVASATAAYGLYNALSPDYEPPKTSKGMIRPYKLDRGPRKEAYETSPTADSSERLYFTDTFTSLEPYEAPGSEYEKAKGGIASLAVGGPVEQMSAMNAVGSNNMYPQSQLQTPMYSNPMIQRPVQSNVITHGLDAPVDQYSGDQKFAEGGETKTEGGYKYSFDPKTQTFTQLSVPKVVQQGGRGGQGQGQEYTRYTGTTPLDPNKDDFYYVTGSMGGPGYYMARGLSGASANTGATVSGGIGAPVGGPSVSSPMQPLQPTQPPINVPAYRSPEEQLGLTDFYTMMNKRLAQQGGYAAGGGVYDLGGYSDGGRLLRGPGDGVSDSIPAVIGNRQPARLADGEFVVPARIVSELGNGSTEAGARKLYAMMDRVQKARRKTVGKNKVAKNTRADKFLPA